MIIDNVLEFKHFGPWGFIRWTCPNGRLTSSLVKAFKKAERMIKEQKLRGWFCGSEKDHVDMHKLLEKVGAKRYGEEDGEILFKKEMN